MQENLKVTIKQNKHKKKTYRHLIFASDDSSATPKVLKYMPNGAIVLSAILCLVLGVVIGYIIFESKSDILFAKKISEKNLAIDELTKSNQELNLEVASLNNTIQILSDTVNSKAKSEAELVETLEAQWIPSAFPLSGGAAFKEILEPEPMCIFDASEGTMVVAAAAGIVKLIEEDDELGFVVTIDHNNGYKTIYKYKDDVMVKEGDSVLQGTTLFIIDSDNTSLYYQVMKDNELINPLDVLEISG